MAVTWKGSLLASHCGLPRPSQGLVHASLYDYWAGGTSAKIRDWFPSLRVFR